jgi:hypothetical protein
MDECVKYINKKFIGVNIGIFFPSLGKDTHRRKWRENVKNRREKGRNAI